MANPATAAMSYQKADNYTFRVPTPPRIVVPPPALNADAVPEIAIHAIRNATYKFLSQVNYHNLVQQNAPLEWTYEMRRQAQTILPFLCLGPMTAAKDEEWLKTEGVTMLLAVRQKHSFESKLMTSALKKAQANGLVAETVDLACNQELASRFDRINAVINNHLRQVYEKTNGQQMGKVLVFCESGNERSAGVVAAFMMETHEDVDYIKAMQLCQAQRFCVNFDDNMKRLLQSYWDILCARRSVAASTAASIPNSAPAKAKRGLERDEEDEAMDVDQDDADRFGGRTFAPFTDQST